MVTFFSEALHQVVVFDRITELSRDEMQTFQAELRQIVSQLDDAIAKEKQNAQLSGIPVNADWLHRITTKRRIALKFATELGSQLQGGTTLKQRAEYEQIYRAKLRAFLEAEFGVTELEEIERELVQESKKEYAAWIEKTNQRMWFLP